MNSQEKFLIKFIKNYVRKVDPLCTKSNIAYFESSISGKDEDYKKVENYNNKLQKLHNSKETYKTLEKLKKSKKIKDTDLKNQLDTLISEFESSKLDQKKLTFLTKMETALEQKFSTFSAKIESKNVTDNEIDEILLKSKNSKKLKCAWEASKEIGEVVEKDVISVVKLRNALAKEAGYKNFHTWSLKESDLVPKELDALFDKLDKLTKKSYFKLKREMDLVLCKKYKVSKLCPWHYQNKFFQDAPNIHGIDYDSMYKNYDIVKLAKSYYSRLGYDVTNILDKSDLFEKKGKQQHAYCTAIDRTGRDVRILENIVPSRNWMNTTLHELGHAIYSAESCGEELPWLLRLEVHTFVTEAIAMLFGRMASNPQWLKNNLGFDDIYKVIFKSLRLEQLIFSRWVQVVYHFEKNMYANPDQDLNKLWWDLVEKYQGLKKPEGRNKPDWAAKIHISTFPCYYHNYLLGEILASQINNHIVKNIMKQKDIKNTDYDTKEVGDFLRNKIFKPGQKYSWKKLISLALKEKLNPKYYAEQFL